LPWWTLSAQFAECPLNRVSSKGYIAAIVELRSPKSVQSDASGRIVAAAHKGAERLRTARELLEPPK